MLAQVVEEAANRFGDTAAFAAPDGTVTSYAELHARACAVAAGLSAQGVGEGDVVALRTASDLGYVLAYLGAARIGAITAGINPKLAVAEQDTLVAMVDPTLVITDRSEVEALERSGASTPAPLEPRSDRDVAIVFTSGTTGLPKGAVFTEKQLTAITEIDVQSRWGGGGHMIASTQFAHVGFMTKLPWYLRLGSTIHMLGKWTAGGVLQLVHEHRIASIGGVAPQIALMVRAPEAKELDFECVKTIVMGGGASSPRLPKGATNKVVLQQLAPWQGTRVLRLSTAEGAFRGWESEPQQARLFQTMMEYFLYRGAWCCSSRNNGNEDGRVYPDIPPPLRNTF